MNSRHLNAVCARYLALPRQRECVVLSFNETKHRGTKRRPGGRYDTSVADDNELKMQRCGRDQRNRMVSLVLGLYCFVVTDF